MAALLPRVGKVATRLASTSAKVIKGITPAGKVIRRLPSTGAKVLKMLTEMENGDTSDRCDTLDSLLGGRLRLASEEVESARLHGLVQHVPHAWEHR